MGRIMTVYTQPHKTIDGALQDLLCFLKMYFYYYLRKVIKASSAVLYHHSHCSGYNPYM